MGYYCTLLLWSKSLKVIGDLYLQLLNQFNCNHLKAVSKPSRMITKCKGIDWYDIFTAMYFYQFVFLHKQIKGTKSVTKKCPFMRLYDKVSSWPVHPVTMSEFVLVCMLLFRLIIHAMLFYIVLLVICIMITSVIPNRRLLDILQCSGKRHPQGISGIV